MWAASGVPLLLLFSWAPACALPWAPRFLAQFGCPVAAVSCFWHAFCCCGLLLACLLCGCELLLACSVKEACGGEGALGTLGVSLGSPRCDLGVALGVDPCSWRTFFAAVGCFWLAVFCCCGLILAWFFCCCGLLLACFVLLWAAGGLLFCCCGLLPFAAAGLANAWEPSS